LNSILVVIWKLNLNFLKKGFFSNFSDVAAWNECVDNSLAQLEHQRTRIANLELMQDYGCDAWKEYNEILQKLVNQLQERLKELKKDIQEVNWTRKNKQTQVGEKLRQLESQWVGLVSKNYEIEQAIVQCEAALPPGTLQKDSMETE